MTPPRTPRQRPRTTMSAALATVDRTTVIKESPDGPDSTGGGGRRHAMLAAPHIAETAEVNVAVEANLDTFLDKDWENKSLADILKAPVSALQGVSEGDADLLKQAFNIKTVGDLGKNKYFRAAQLLAQLAEAGAK